MEREYELFERRPDGTLNWRGVVQGRESTRVSLYLLISETGNECFAAGSRGDIMTVATGALSS